MGGLVSWFRKKDPQTPVKGLGERIKNIFTYNFRGIIGFFVPLFALSWQGVKGKHDITVSLLWIGMLWSYFWQPVSIPATGLIPLFILPMCGVMSTPDTCHCYFTENTALFLLGSMIHLLMNNSGVDRRIALWFLCSGDASQFSGKRLIFKASTAAFLLSMCCNKLIVSSNIIQFLSPILTNLQVLKQKIILSGRATLQLHMVAALMCFVFHMSATSRSRSSEADYDEMRYIVNNAIQTASSIGSIGIIHASFGTLFFRTIWSESPPKGMEYPDIFNYLQYSSFAIPTALVMFIVNVVYHMMLLDRYVAKPMSAYAMEEAKKSLQKHKDNLPKKIGNHEKMTVFFITAALLLFLFRWCKWLNMGWSTFRRETSSPDIPGIKDATVAAIFVCGLHILPRTFGFLKYFTAKRKCDLPPLKPESAILWWSFVNKNTNYAYFLVLGSGVALNVATRESKLAQALAAGLGKYFTKYEWNVSILLVVLFAIILANIMPGVAACCIFLPFVINMAAEPDAPVPWPKNVYLGALAVGISSSMTFLFPFLYTPAYFCHYTGKVPMKKMIKYSIFSSIICMLIIWLAVCFWAPVVWDPSGEGFSPLAGPEGATEGGGGGGGDAGGGGSGGGGDGGGGGGGGGEPPPPPPPPG